MDKMETNSKGQVIIYSFEELPPSQRRKLKRAGTGIGMLVVLIYFLLLLLFRGLSSLSADDFLWLVCAIGPFLIGRDIGVRMQLARMGVSLPKPPYPGGLYQSRNHRGSDRT